MVRHGKPISEILEIETQPRRRHSTSHPPDNIGISCTVHTDDSKDKIITGRRRSLVVPRDNIGIACLPTNERLHNILEVPEYETSDDEVKRSVQTPRNRKSAMPQTSVAARARVNSTRDDVAESTTSSTESETVPNRNLRYHRGRSYKQRDTVGLLWHECTEESSKRCDESKKAENKFQVEMGISNVRRSKDDPTKPRKPIMPRDNIGFACRPLHKSTGRLSGPRLSAGVNLKNSSNGIERKNILHAKPPTGARNENITGEQIKTLRASDMKTFEKRPEREIQTLKSKKK